MDESTLQSELDYLAEHESIFVLDDLIAFGEGNQSTTNGQQEPIGELILEYIKNDLRFLNANNKVTNKAIFISKKTLTRWYIDLNINLAKTATHRLKANKLEQLMSSLLEYRDWQEFPREFIAFGNSLSLIKNGIEQGEYIFPLARILSFVSSSNIESVRDFLFDLISSHVGDQSLNIDELTLQIFGYLTEREQRVIELRFGLRNGHRHTLEDIGKEFNLTRERIRQIEEKALKKLNHPVYKKRLLASLIKYILNNNGSLLINSASAPSVLLIAKQINIPIARFPLTRYFVLGQAPFKLGEIRLLCKELPESDTFGPSICENLNMILTRNEWTRISEDLMQPLVKGLTKSEKVYLALKQLGKASHFEEIHEMYCELFPEEMPTVHSIHAILSREEKGIVWVGKKGTFSLEEWGDNRPELSIVDAVADIVIKRYAETKEPVPLSVIQAEIGKYRRYVNQGSISLAACHNQRLQQTSANCFIPKDIVENEEPDYPDNDINELLIDFESHIEHG